MSAGQSFFDPEKEKFVGAWVMMEFYDALVRKAHSNRSTISDEVRKAIELYVRPEVIEARR